MTNEIRLKVERAMVRKVIRSAVKAGFVPVKVWDGQEYVSVRTETETLDAVFAVDESTIHFAPKDNPTKWGNLGVLCIGGNGQDIISDYHCGNEAFSAAIASATEEDIQVR